MKETENPGISRDYVFKKNSVIWLTSEGFQESSPS